MTNKEREAIIDYLSFRFRAFTNTFESHLDPTLSYHMHEILFDILRDLDDNIVTNQLYEISEKGLLEKYVKQKNLPKKDD